MLPSCLIKETVSTYSCWLAVEEAWVPRAGSAGTPHRNRHGGGWPEGAQSGKGAGVARIGRSWLQVLLQRCFWQILARVISTSHHFHPGRGRSSLGGGELGRARESSGRLSSPADTLLMSLPPDHHCSVELQDALQLATSRSRGRSLFLKADICYGEANQRC